MATEKVFSIEGKGLKLTTAEDIAPHIKDLEANNEVEEVIFVGNTLGVGASEALAKVLETKKKLKVANLADIFTSRLLSEIPLALDALLQACLTLPDLHTINLSDNAFGLNTQAPLVAFLSAHTPLRHLILNNNGLGPAAGVLIADALSALANKKEDTRKEGKEVPNLETVVCGRNRLENGSMAAWAKAYTSHSGVKSVKMVQNGIRQEGITHLIRNGFANTKGLELLDLQDNTFTAMGARALADTVATWGDIRELGVSDCLLSARGGVAVAGALKKGGNEKLEVLRLQYDDIDSKGVKALADALEKLPLLRRVELNGNKFDEENEDIERIREGLNEVKSKKEGEWSHLTEDEDWGLDELDELEDESDEEDEEEDEAEAEEEDESVETQERIAREAVNAEKAENENVAEEKDKKVDDLADLLGKAEIK